MTTDSEASVGFDVSKIAGSGVSSDNTGVPLEKQSNVKKLINKKDVDVIMLKDSFDTTASGEQGSIFDTEV